MGILFVRQIMILRESSKINYAPIILGIGVAGGLVHFIIYPQEIDFILLFRESLLSVLVGTTFYIVLNILNQIQTTDEEDSYHNDILNRIDELKNVVSNLENRIALFTKNEQKVQNEVNEKLKIDIETLKEIEQNQMKFLDKFDQFSILYEDISLSFRNFTELQIPELDTIVHKHIDILRVANQDHYNHLKADLNTIVTSRTEIFKESKDLKRNFSDIKNLSDDIANSIKKSTMQQFREFTQLLDTQVVSLHNHTKAVLTKLQSSETILADIKEHSEIVNKQMDLSSTKMDEFEKYKNSIVEIYAVSRKLTLDIELIKADYIKSQMKLEMIAGDFKLSESEQLEAMQQQIVSLSDVLSAKIENSLSKLHQHYHIADEEITQSVHKLSQRSKLQNGYGS